METWKHGGNLAVEWFRGNPTFYNIFKDTCSLNTTTGELTINDVRPEHSGVYTPDINLRTRSAMELRVFSPVPKPSISHDCVPGETLTCTLTCTLTFTLTCTDTCKIDTTGDLGDVEVSWILNDRRREKGSELPITKDTKEETFICSVKNPVSSENSTKLLNPLLPGETGVPWWKPVIGTLVSLALLAFVCWKWVYPLYKRDRMIKEIQETMPLTEHDRILEELRAVEPVTEHDRISAETPAAESVPEVEQILLKADKVILGILRKGKQRFLTEGPKMIFKEKRGRTLSAGHERNSNEKRERNLSEDSIVMLLTARYMILRKLREGPEVKESLDKVEKIMKMFYEGKYELQLYADKEPTLQDVYQMILRILLKKDELNLSADKEPTLLDGHEGILRILKKKEELNLPEEEEQKVNDGHEGILRILKKKEELQLSADDYQELQHVNEKISAIILSMEGITGIDAAEWKRQNEEEVRLIDEYYLHLYGRNRVIKEIRERKPLTGWRSPNEEDLKLKDVHQRIWRFLRERDALDLPEDDYQALQDVQRMISTIIFKRNERRRKEGSAAGGGVDQPEETTTLLKTGESSQTPTVSVTNETNPQTGASNDTRDPAAERLISFSRPEAEDPV